MENVTQLRFTDFEQMLEKWDECFFLSAGSSFGGYYAVNISDFARELWETLTMESCDVQDLYERGLAKSRAEEFKYYYSNPEKIAQHYMDPYYAPKSLFEGLSPYAQQIILNENFLDVAVKNYTRAKQIAMESRRQQKKRKKSDVGTIYLLQSQYGFKIGKTKNLQSRSSLFL